MGRIKMLQGRLQPSEPKRGTWSDPRRGNRHQRGYGADWERERKVVLRRDGGLCQPCLRRGHTTPNCNTVDHIVNKAQGGTDDRRNLQTICSTCHSRKTQAESRGETWDEALA
jgi:5-methylcytosine-specific restriction protein A